MDTTNELIGIADRLQAVATRLIAPTNPVTGQPTDKRTHGLARSVLSWTIAIRCLAESGQAAWIESQRDFPVDPAHPPAPDASDQFATYRAQLDLTTALVVGDVAMDDFAYSELARRGRLPEWTIGHVPAWWREFMVVLDDEPDRMTSPARYLDVTLAAARDRLIVHRDPDGWELPSWSSWGAVGRGHRHVEPERRAMALDELRAVNASLNRPWPYDEYDHLLDTLIATAGHLGAEQRQGIRRAYAFAGLDAPPNHRRG